MANIHINSDNIEYTSESIISKYVYQTTSVNVDKSRISVKPVDFNVTFKTKRNVSKLGVMLVGWGGNNGSTFTGAHLANKHKISWMTKSGVKEPNWFGSVLQSSTVSLGFSQNGEIYVPMRDMLPMVDPNDLIIDGWDISSLNLAEAMKRAEVFDYDLQRQLIPHMEGLKPRAAVHRPDFVAANQSERADNVVLLDHAADQVTSIRNDIKDFKSKHDVDTVIVLWTANTERFCDILPGIHDTAENLMNSVKRNEAEISTSTIYAIASILEGCSYINGSPQNTFVPGVIELAEQYNVFLGGDDFKSGQTKIKSVLVDFLVSAGIKPVSIVSYNHLGNNDGKNLSAPKQFRSKEISKSNVVDDMVESNDILYGKDEKPDHVVVIKYVPAVKDSKRAMDEYISEILMHGTNTLAIHNTCEDSLLATPIILDLVLLTELCQRVQIKVGADGEYQNFNTILSLLSYLLKAPLVPKDTPLVNALFKQRAAIENIMRAMLSLPAQNHMLLEYKLADMSVFQKDLQMKNIQTIEKYNSCMKVPKSKIENGLYTNVLNSAIH
ncbi:inositol-3-phosphate synthase [Hydra vulgaris]|uniref:inositol-3-phosphate synthase n=1 Tax=Hydra vulgaris TaxID=6087 RepID=A0ABM4DPG2_HYDVU